MLPYILPKRSLCLRYLLLPILAVMCVVQIWVTPAYATGIYDFPPVASGDSTWVIDQAEILSRINEGKISGQFEDLAKATGQEIRFVTIHRLDYGETVDSFTDQLFEKWFPTPEAQSNQVLFVIDNVTNGTAIRTGSEAKGLLTDDIAASVAQETVQVPLRQGNKYNQALLDASDRLVAVLSGEPDPGPPIVDNTVQTEGTFASVEKTKESNATTWVIVLLVVATVVPMATYYFYQSFQ